MNIAAVVERNHFDLMMESQYWPADQIAAYQREQLTKLLQHARAHVPFYEHRLDAVFNNDGSINMERWRDISIVTRKDLADSHQQMQATQMLPEYGSLGKYFSSGTTGKPVETTHNAYASWANRAAVIRAYHWHGIDWNRNTCKFHLMPDSHQWPDGKPLGNWGPAWDNNQKGEFWQFERAIPLERMLELMAYRNVLYVSTRPKAAHMIAQAAKQSGFKLKLDAVMAVGTGVEWGDRQLCEEAFGAWTVSLYSSKEGYKMAYQCPTGFHFHMMSELSLMEILNDKNEPCAPGETGRVIITPFFSYAQPLIRYEQGDLAEVGAPCKCGRTLPVINRIAGRVMNMFRFPNGLKVAPVLPDYCRNAFGPITWQVAQTAPLTVELRYCCEQEINNEAQAYIASILHQTMYADIEVLFKKLNEIPVDANDKFNEYVCELPAE